MQHHGEGDQPGIGLTGTFDIPRSQALPHHNRDHTAHGEHDNGKQVPHRALDIGGGHHRQPPGAVALVDHSAAQ